MLPHNSGWDTSAAFVCYKQATVAETVLQHVKVVPGLRDPVVIQRATRETAHNDENNASSTWWVAAVYRQPSVTSPYTLFVANLPPNATTLDLHKIFSLFGAINTKGVKTAKTEDGYSCKGFGFVEFMDNSAAGQAIAKLNGMRLPDGHTLKVAKKAARGGTIEVQIIADIIV